MKREEHQKITWAMSICNNLCLNLLWISFWRCYSFFPLNNQLYKIVYVRVPRITLCCCYSSVRGSESEVSQCVLSLHTPESRVISANGRKLNTKASSSSTNIHKHRVALIGSVLLQSDITISPQLSYHDMIVEWFDMSDITLILTSAPFAQFSNTGSKSINY